MSKIENNIVSYLTAKNCQRIGLVRDESLDKKWNSSWRGYRLEDKIVVRQQRSEEEGVSFHISLPEGIWCDDEDRGKYTTFYESREVKAINSKTYKEGVDLNLLSAHLTAVLDRIEKIKKDEFSEEEAQDFREKVTAEIKAGEEALANTRLSASWNALDLYAVKHAAEEAAEIKSRIIKLKAHLEEFEKAGNLKKMRFAGELGGFLDNNCCSFYAKYLRDYIREATENKRTYYR